MDKLLKKRFDWVYLRLEEAQDAWRYHKSDKFAKRPNIAGH